MRGYHIIGLAARFFKMLRTLDLSATTNPEFNLQLI